MFLKIATIGTLDLPYRPALAVRYPGEMKRVHHDAVRAAAHFVRQRRDLLPERVVPASATQHAVLAIRLQDVFLQQND